MLSVGVIERSITLLADNLGRHVWVVPVLSRAVYWRNCTPSAKRYPEVLRTAVV
jgi:hypothetical protein